jgi:hypothetical protein
MESFFSSALGAPHEYKAGFSNRVALVILARTGKAGDLECRPQGSSGPYGEVWHSVAQVKQVLLDHDKIELSC